MATDIVGGTTGDVTASGFNGDIDAWSASIQVTEATWRTFASPWQKRANVTYAMTGQFSGTIQFDAASTKPLPSVSGGDITESSFEGISLTLTAETGCTYSGTANITGVDINRPAIDRMTGTWRFAFDGTPQQTWDETA